MEKLQIFIFPYSNFVSLVSWRYVTPSMQSRTAYPPDSLTNRLPKPEYATGRTPARKKNSYKPVKCHVTQVASTCVWNGETVNLHPLISLFKFCQSQLASQNQNTQQHCMWSKWQLCSNWGKLALSGDVNWLRGRTVLGKTQITEGIARMGRYDKPPPPAVYGCSLTSTSLQNISIYYRNSKT